MECALARVGAGRRSGVGHRLWIGLRDDHGGGSTVARSAAPSAMDGRTVGKHDLCRRASITGEAKPAQSTSWIIGSRRVPWLTAFTTDAGITAMSEETNEEIDPSWWAAPFESTPEPGGFEAPEILSSSFEAFLKGSDIGELQRRVLEALTIATSAMLVPDNWLEPYEPAMQFRGRRTAIPSDLDAEQVALLARLAPPNRPTDPPGTRRRRCLVLRGPRKRPAP